MDFCVQSVPSQALIPEGLITPATSGTMKGEAGILTQGGLANLGIWKYPMYN